MRERFNTDEELSDKDRETILEIATQSTGTLSASPNGLNPESKQEAKTEVQSQKSGTQPELRRSHERNYGKSAPKDQQSRRSSIRRPHDESPGSLEYRTIREISECIV